MAVWQYDFYIIKKENVPFYNELLSFNNDDNDKLLTWEKSEINSIENIEKLLPQEKSWTEKNKQYGKIDESCMEIFSLNDIQCQMSFRLDLRSLCNELFNEVVNFIQSNDGYIVAFDQKDKRWNRRTKCYPADIYTLSDLIKESNAYKFCKKPYEFLGSLKKQ